MGITVGDVILKIGKYEKLREKLSASFSECTTNDFESRDDVLTFIKSKLTYDDIVQLQLLLENQIEMLKKVKVVEDEGND